MLGELGASERARSAGLGRLLVAGLDRESVALCHQVTTLDRAKLTKRIAVLPAAELAALGRGLMIAQDLG